MVTAFSLSLQNNKNRGIPYFLKIPKIKEGVFIFMSNLLYRRNKF